MVISIDSQPLACASIAQVHCTLLDSGQQVVLKIIKPGVKNNIAVDIKIMMFCASMINYLIKGSKISFKEVVDQFARTLNSEIDLLKRLVTRLG